MYDTKLAERVKLYLESKFARDIFGDHKHPLYFAVKGIKAQLWFRVVKLELERLAAEHDHALVIHIEKPTNQFLEFEFTALRASMPPAAVHEPPLTDAELRAVRKLIKWGGS